MSDRVRIGGYYEIIASLATGGMGEVYLARDSRLDRNVAIKVLAHKFRSEDDAIGRFTREARAASALNHPNVLSIYEVAKEGDVAYLVMEYIDGRDLRSIIRDEAPLPLFSALALGSQIASGLTAAHERGIVHRDLKPENILVATSGLVKIVDFGLGRFATIADDEHALRESHTLVGTLQYMSPEQLQGRNIDGRSDLFSLGVILYELVGGRPPFSGHSSVELLKSILSDQPRVPFQNSDDPHREFWRLVQRLLEKDPDDRYPEARQVVDEIRSLHESLARKRRARAAMSPESMLASELDRLAIELSNTQDQAREYRSVLKEYEQWARAFARGTPEEAAR